MTRSRTTNESVAISAYFLVGVFWYMLDKNVRNSFTKHHVKQAVNYSFISYIVYGVIIAVNMYVVFPSGIIFTNPILTILILSLMGVIIFFLFSLYVIQTHAIFSNKKSYVPYIGKLADKYLSF
ncbi:MAG: hypothetical protein ACLFPL_05540 [Candidatus Nanoarchaeia archaeon]